MAEILGSGDFAGKAVFVAGGTSGINLGIARAFARHGARVAVLSRSREKVDAAVQTLDEDGAQATLGFAADVRDYEAVADAFAETAREWGPIDALISGAAGNFVAPAMGISSGGFRAVMDIDLLGTFHVMRASFDHLRKPGAAAINISAPQAVHPYPMQAHVCAAKAGIDQLARVLAVEWGPEGVRINNISPGPIGDTEGMKRLAPTEEIADGIKARVPLRRYGTSEEVADLALFLCSPRAAYITGAVIPVDGGTQLFGAGPMADAMEAAVKAAGQG